MMHCTNCNQSVMPIKRWDWGLFWVCFIVGFFTVGFGHVAYLIYYLLKRRDVCPICGLKMR